MCRIRINRLVQATKLPNMAQPNQCLLHPPRGGLPGLPPGYFLPYPAHFSRL
nr:MAG TPA: hypothetical protein [Caudoviricetes sp.]